MHSFTPLHLVLRAGQLEVAPFLVDHGADVVRPGHGTVLRPLHLARCERVELEATARFLIDHGADVNAQDTTEIDSITSVVAGRSEAGNRSLPCRPRRGC